MQTELQGQLERITFRSEENHFTIAKIKVKGHKNLVTVVGNLLPVSPGEILKLTGTWTDIRNTVNSSNSHRARLLSCHTARYRALPGLRSH